MSTLYNYDIGIDFEYVELGCCGFGTLLPHDFIQRRRKDHKHFYCPSCGQNSYYPQKSDKEILKEKLEAERNTNEFLRKQNEKERNRTRAEKAAKTRIKNRIKNGVCPCCNRHFKNLHQHMKNQHPDYVKDKKK